MRLQRHVTEELIYGPKTGRRHTQDSPVLPDVWIRYGERPLEPQDLLLTPHFGATAGEVSRVLRQAVGAERQGPRRPEHESADIAYNQTYVVARLYFDELVRLVLPMTSWFQEFVLDEALGLKQMEADQRAFELLGDPDVRERLTGALEQFARGAEGLGPVAREPEGGVRLTCDLLWMMRIVGALAYVRRQALAKEVAPEDDQDVELPSAAEMVRAIAKLMGDLTLPPEVLLEPGQDRCARRFRKLVWLVNLNREAHTAVTRSNLAIKGDAARLLFKISCKDLAWGIIDSGVDARHPAFWTRPGGPDNDPREDEEFDDWADYTRVVRTYDFTRIRDLLDPGKLDPSRPDVPEWVRSLLSKAKAAGKPLADDLRELRDRLLVGRHIDWGLLEPFLRIPHDEDYQPPASEHGTHVAGILASDWPQEELAGICPDIKLYDLRVLNPGVGGSGNDEFAVLAALQFVNHLNDQKDFYAIHGVNMSLSIRHEVANFACGRTPVCDECERLVASGVVVVAAAGNEGYLHYITRAATDQIRQTDGYQTVSITDPGNADKVITVGSTHRFQPHTYGVSYFSSRGPTGDGRIKPDLVAPGEKIEAPVPGALGAARDFGKRKKDGTSMAAPHVSGAAAMLMARHSEFIGRPEEVKQVLCSTATDLKRERYFQGSGMLDVLRALQSV